MKGSGKILCAVLAAVLVLAMGTAMAGESYYFDVKVTCPDQYAVRSPFDGKIRELYTGAGNIVEAGERLYAMAPTNLVANKAGTILTVPAVVGCDGAATKETYDGAVVLLPEHPLYMKAQIKGSSLSRIGDNVDLLASSGNRGTGRIIRIKDNAYEIEILTGNLQAGDTVSVYARGKAPKAEAGAEGEEAEDSAADKRIAKGNAEELAPTYYNFEGYAIEIAVKAGDTVKPGDVLLTYAPAPGLVVTAPEKAAVVSATTGEGVTLAPLESFCFSAYLSSSDLELLETRNTILMTSYGGSGKEMKMKISWVSTVPNSDGKYEVRFESDGIRASDYRLGKTFNGEAE